MKFKVSIVVSIVVFVVNCHGLPDIRDTSGSLEYSGNKRFQKEQKSRGDSKCKSDIVCSLLGGSCVTDSTYCAGREVSTVCKGTKCKCCIPVTLELKVHDLETELRSMVANLTVSNSNLQSEMRTMMNNAISNIENELEVIKENITNSNANQDGKLDSISDNQETVDLKLDNFTQKLLTLKTKMNNISFDLSSEFQTLQQNSDLSNSNITTELKSLKSSIDSGFSKVNTKLDTLDPKECSTYDGFFALPSSPNQCFKVIKEDLTWFDAKKKCEAEGLILAKPSGPVEMRKYILQKTGGCHAWLGARGTGSSIKWERDGTTIPIKSSLWNSRYMGSNGAVGWTATDKCLWFQAWAGNDDNEPIRMYSCTYKSSMCRLCEVP